MWGEGGSKMDQNKYVFDGHSHTHVNLCTGGLWLWPVFHNAALEELLVMLWWLICWLLRYLNKIAWIEKAFMGSNKYKSKQILIQFNVVKHRMCSRLRLDKISSVYSFSSPIHQPCLKPSPLTPSQNFIQEHWTWRNFEIFRPSPVFSHLRSLRTIPCCLRSTTNFLQILHLRSRLLFVISKHLQWWAWQ